MTTEKQAGVGLRELCTWRIGGAADSILRPSTIGDFSDAVRTLAHGKAPFHVLGRCSNVLFSSEGVHEPIILTTELTACALLREHPEGFALFREVAEEDTGGEYIYVEAGAPNAKLLALAADKGLTGAECLAGVPGTFGGAAAMNAENFMGALQNDVWLALVTPEGVHIEPASRFECAYRRYELKGAYIAAALLFLRADAPEDVRGRMRQRLEKRALSQPLDWPSAGCVFRNPPGDYAGALLDRAGMKGLNRGDAVYSDKHANFILNLGSATSGEVLELMALGKRAVHEAFGRCLMPEIKFIGGFPEDTLAFLLKDTEGSDGRT